jgi:GTP-binding protein
MCAAYKSLIVTRCNQTDALPGAYRRFLTNTFREKLQVVGTPIRLEFKSSTNPFEHKKPATAARSGKPQTRRPQKPGKRGQ